MEQTNRTKELGTAPISSLLLKYAIPAVIAMAASSLYNIVDRIFIGHIPDVGTLSLGGLAVTFPVMNLAAAFGAMVGVGGSTLMSIKLGQRDYESAKRVLGNIVSLNIIMGILVSVVALIFIHPLLTFFGASENTYPYAYEYMFIILLGNVIPHLYLGLNAALRSTGHPRAAMMATVATVVVNSILDPLFIFTLGMGIRGAAIATVLSQLFALCFVWIKLSSPKDLIHLQRGIYGLHSTIVRTILSIGLSPFCMQLCACLVVILINKGLATHGGDIAIAAYGIINSVLFLSVMIVLGICQGMQPIAGFNYGAQLYDRVNLVLRYAIYMATTVMCIEFVICEFFPEYIILPFTSDTDLTRISVIAMRIIVCMSPLVGFQIVTSNFFQSIGMPKRSIFLSVSRQLVFLVPFLIIFPELPTADGTLLGTNGVWIAIAAADAIAFITSAIMLWQYYHGGESTHLKSQARAQSLPHRIAAFFNNRLTH